MQKDHSQHRFCDVVKSISDYRIFNILFVIIFFEVTMSALISAIVIQL